MNPGSSKLRSMKLSKEEKLEIVTGAQIAGKNVDSTFWDDVEAELERLDKAKKPKVERRLTRDN